MPGFTPSRFSVSATLRVAFAVVVGAGMSLAGLHGVAQAQVDVSGSVTVAGPTAPGATGPAPAPPAAVPAPAPAAAPAPAPAGAEGNVFPPQWQSAAVQVAGGGSC